MMAPSAAPPKVPPIGAAGLFVARRLARRDIAGARRGIAAAEHVARALVLRAALVCADLAPCAGPARVTLVGVRSAESGR